MLIVGLQFIHGSISKSPDIYLDELKQGLEETCGTSVSLSTVWRALKRSGFTMKKVNTIYNRNPACLA